MTPTFTRHLRTIWEKALLQSHFFTSTYIHRFTSILRNIPKNYPTSAFVTLRNSNSRHVSPSVGVRVWGGEVWGGNERKKAGGWVRCWLTTALTVRLEIVCLEVNWKENITKLWIIIIGSLLDILVDGTSSRSRTFNHADRHYQYLRWNLANGADETC